VTPAGWGKGSAAAGGRLTDAGNEREEGRNARPAHSIEDDEVIEKILAHVDAQVQRPKAATLPPSRAPPQLEIDDDWL
jgi:hypothetical protein